MEQARSLAALVMAVIALISIGQVAAEHSASSGEANARAAALDVAVRFATALTTYDYEHLEIQRRQLEHFADSRTVALAASAATDVVNVRGSAIGTVIASTIASLEGRTASVIAEVEQIVSNSLVGQGRSLKGTLRCQLTSTAQGSWVVVSFDWLVVPSPQVPAESS